MARVERARLNMHLCFETEVGKRYVSDRFTLLALLVGSPARKPNMRAFAFWQEFGSAFEKVFDLAPDSLTMTDIDEWIKAYERWYAQEEAKLTNSS